MSVRYLDLVDYVAIATEITGLDADRLTKVAALGLSGTCAQGLGPTMPRA